MRTKNITKISFSFFFLFFFLGSFVYFIEGLNSFRTPLLVISVFFAVFGFSFNIKYFIRSRAFVLLFFVVSISVFLYVFKSSEYYGIDYEALLSVLVFWFVILYTQTVDLDDLSLNIFVFFIVLFFSILLLLAINLDFLKSINPNATAILSVALTLLALYGYLFKSINIILFLLVFLFSFYIAIYYQSRTSSVILLLMIVSVFFDNFKKTFNMKAFYFLLFILPALLVLLNYGFLDRLIDKNSSNINSGSITSGRAYVWQLALNKISLLGEHSKQIKGYLPYGVHNTYLSFAWRYGVIQFLISFSLLFLFFLYYSKNLISNKKVLALFFPFLILAMFEEVNGSHVFLFMLLSIAIIRKNRIKYLN